MGSWEGSRACWILLKRFQDIMHDSMASEDRLQMDKMADTIYVLVRKG